MHHIIPYRILYVLYIKITPLESGRNSIFSRNELILPPGWLEKFRNNFNFSCNEGDKRIKVGQLEHFADTFT